MADDTLSSSCGSSSSTEEVKFRQVTVGSSTPRSVVRKMWAQGRLAGLFNIPDEEVFNACQDFVMEVPLLPRDAPYVQREAELGAQIGMLKKEVELLRCSNRSLNADNQRLQAEHKRLRHEVCISSFPSFPNVSFEAAHGYLFIESSLGCSSLWHLID